MNRRLTAEADVAYNDFTLAGVAEFSVSNGKLGDDSQPNVRVPKARTSLKLCSPAKGVEHNGVRTLRLGGL